MCHVSKQICEMFRKRRLIDLLCTQVVLHNQTSAQLKRWAIHALVYLCLKEEVGTVFLSADMQVRLNTTLSK